MGEMVRGGNGGLLRGNQWRKGGAGLTRRRQVGRPVARHLGRRWQGRRVGGQAAAGRRRRGLLSGWHRRS